MVWLAIKILLVSLAFVYAVCAFSSGELNFMNWGYQGRTLAVVAWASLAALVGLVVVDVE